MSICFPVYEPDNRLENRLNDRLMNQHWFWTIMFHNIFLSRLLSYIIDIGFVLCNNDWDEVFNSMHWKILLKRVEVRNTKRKQRKQDVGSGLWVLQLVKQNQPVTVLLNYFIKPGGAPFTFIYIFLVLMKYWHFLHYYFFFS